MIHHAATYMCVPAAVVSSRRIDRAIACAAVIAGLLISAAPAYSDEQPDQPQKPNFVVITVDDLGYADIGPHQGETFSRVYDRMAHEGMVLKSHYAAPVCSPSRAALMTGCYPKRCLPTPHVLFPAAAVGLNPDEVTIAEVLKSAGYDTACIGKWHLGDQPEFLPTRQGFDSYYGIPYSNDMGPSADGSKSNLNAALPRPKSNILNTTKADAAVDETGLRGDAQPPLPLLENEKVVGRVYAAEQAQLIKKYSDRAADYIYRHREQKRPFFLYLPYNAIHFPFYPSPKYAFKTKSTLLKDWVVEMDDGLRTVMNAIYSSGLARSTIVIFMSDNGGSIPHGSSNAPLRGSKGSTLEGGIRVYAVAWGFGHVPPRTSTDEITSNMDILPTFAAIAGAKLPADRKIDGKNIQDLLLGRATDGKPASGRDAFHYFRGHELEAARQGPWKLHLAKGELYDLKADIGEATNVAADNPTIVEQLRKLATEMDADLGAKALGPGVRPLGRVKDPQPLIDLDGNVRRGFESGM